VDAALQFVATILAFRHPHGRNRIIIDESTEQVDDALSRGLTLFVAEETATQ